MSTDREYSFRMERTSYKSQDLIYEEPGHKLVVYLEMSGLRKVDWVGCETDFHQWTEPPHETIPAHTQAEILRRLATWTQAHRIRIKFGPAIDMKAYFAEQEKAGWTLERRGDGTILARPPAVRGLWARAVGVTKLWLKIWGF